MSRHSAVARVVLGALIFASACSSGSAGNDDDDTAGLPTAGGGASGLSGSLPAVDAGGDTDAGSSQAGTGALDAGVEDAAISGDAALDAEVDAAPPPLPACVCDGSVVLDARCNTECATAFETLFADRQLPAFYLTIPDDNAADGSTSWDLMAACTQKEAASKMPPLRCEEQIGSFHAVYDPNPDDALAETITTPEIEVGIRRKGRYSWQPLDGKPSFKVKFPAFGGERFMGLKSLTLNNMIQDPSFLHERTAYRIFRDANVAAPLANHALVYVRKGETLDYELYGVYANVQTLDSRFVHHAFGEVNGEIGNLYDTYNDVYFTDLDRSSSRDQAGSAAGAQEARFQLETNETVNDKSDLTAAINAVYTSSLFPTAIDNSQFVENMAPVIDVTAFLRMFAVQALIADWDGFPGARNNYKLYHDLVRDRFVMLPWGTDQTFGLQGGYNINWDYSIDHQDSNRTSSLFMIRCLDDASDCYMRFETELSDVMAGFDATVLGDAIDAWEVQIQDSVALDVKAPFDLDTFHRNVMYLRDYLDNRSACVNAQLTTGSCANRSCPAGSAGDCKP